MNAPAIYPELGLRVDCGVPVVNSREVAAKFGKRHDNVLRDIKDLEISSELRRSWFRETTSVDGYGRDQPSVDMTRQGFTLLTMGWSGKTAMAFKVRYIQAFDEMELALNEGGPVTGTDLIRAVKEIVAPLAVRFDGQDQAIGRIEDRQERQEDSIDRIEKQLTQLADSKRKHLKPQDKAKLIAAVLHVNGGRCPCGCSRIIVAQEGMKTDFLEFDHFYQVQRADVDSCWPLHRMCNAEFATGKRTRHDFEAAFRAFQSARRRLAGPNLFDLVGVELPAQQGVEKRA